MEQTNLSQVLEELKICGCGLPEYTINIIRDILIIIHETNIEMRQESILNLLGINEDNHNVYGLYQYLLYTLDEAGYITHGSSIGGAWITDKGIDLLFKLINIEETDYYE